MEQLPEVAKLNSSNLDVATYYAGDHELVILFHSGKTYKWIGVPREIFTGLRTAESPGKFFNANIKDHFPLVVIDP